LSTFRRKARTRYGVIAILGAVLLFWVPLRDYCMAEIVHDVPPIRDLSTDPEHAPPAAGLPRERPVRALR